MNDLEEIMRIIEEHLEKTGDCMCRTEDSDGNSYCASNMKDCKYYDLNVQRFTFRRDDNGKYLQSFYGCKYEVLKDDT